MTCILQGKKTGMNFMIKSSSVKWGEGVRFMQFTNSAHHCKIKSTPYKIMFDCLAKVGYMSSSRKI